MATMSQAIREAFGGGGEALSREAIKQSVESRYPGKWKPATLSAHLYACAINNQRAYVHHPSPFKVHVTRTSEAPPQTNKHVG